MKQTINVGELKEDTVQGCSVTVTLTYSDFDREKVEQMQKELLSKFGFASVLDMPISLT